MRVLVADDHPLYRIGVVHALREALPGVEVAEAGSLSATLDTLAGAPAVDLLILDLQMPGCSGLDALRAVRQAQSEVPVLVLSANEDPAVVRECVELGAMGYVPKSAPPDLLPTALEHVLAGGVFLPHSSLSLAPSQPPAGRRGPWDKLGARLTARQCQVLHGLVEGKPNKVIARQLGLSDATVKTHVSHIFAALEVSNRTEAVYALARAGVSIRELQAGSS